MADAQRKTYSYYPGCSLHSSGKAYDESTRAVADVLGVELVELDDWNCCGATAYMGICEITAFSISARNLAIAEKTGKPVVAPCSGCFVGLRKANAYFEEFPEVHRKVNEALAAGGLAYRGTVDVRHVLDVLVRDVGLERIAEKVTRPLTGLRVGCYYGCQIVRPKNGVDDPELPSTMEALMGALGASPVPFAMKASCCGGSVMGTEESAGLALVGNLLQCAKKGGAQVLVTPCPLCQMNIDAYQLRVEKKRGMPLRTPILYFTQLVGLALGIEPKRLGIGREIVSASEVLRPFL